ncbi:MAG: hypothetical protein EP343_12775 [Deltaproteobacteria bacterium]|nr:MAG: hypothetical protein EP343_12775 [Deltaproteobacteria bacterium]
MGRWILLVLGVSLSLFSNKPAAAQTAPAAPPQRLVVAVFQQLDETKKLPPLLQSFNEAYRRRTGQIALKVQQVREGFGGHFGPKVLRGCRAKAGCLTKKLKVFFPKATLGIFLGVGGLGDSILLKIVLADLTTGKELKQLRQSFSNLNDAKAKLPGLMAKMFPNYGTIRWSGLPKGASITVQGRTFEPPVLPLPGGQKTSVEVKAPGYKAKSFTLEVAANKEKTVTVKLKKEKKTVIVRRPPPPIRQPGTSQPVTKKWWFWTIIGVAAVGAGVGVVAGVLSQPSRKEGDFIPVELPTPN